MNYKKLLSTLLCTSFFASMAVMPASAALSPDTTTAQGWTAAFAGSAEGYIKLDNENAYDGEYSLKIVDNTPAKANTYMRVHTNISVTQGKTYEVGFAAKSLKSTTVQLMFAWDKRRDLLPFGKTYDWTERVIEYTATTSGEVEMIFLIDGTTEGFWLDNVYVKEKGTDKNLVSNPDFELVAKAEEEEPEDFGEEIASLEGTYNKIKTAKSFTQSEFERVRGGFKFIPIYKTSGITIDGKKDDWANVPDIYMPTLPTQYQVYIKDEREKDATVNSKFAWDEEYFYVYLEATDDIYFPKNESEQYWAGDSFQFAISRMDDLYGTEIGISHNDPKDYTEIYSTALSKTDMATISAKSSHEGNVTIYELRMPWNLFFNERYSRPEELLFDFLYNDNDGDGRRYCVELAPGISEGKTNAKFPVLRLMEETKPWYAWIDGNKDAIAKEENTYSLYVVNGDSQAKTFKINLPNGEEKEQTVEANMGVRIPFVMNFAEELTYTLEAQISDGEYTYKSSYEVIAALVPPSTEEAAADLEVFKGYAKELKQLLDKCEKQGLSVDYPLVNYSTIEKFIIYIQRDIDNNDLGLFHYQKRCIEDLYKEAKEELENYLSGAEEPIPVPRYVTSELTVKNSAVYGTTETDGNTEERPIFFIGYGHFGDAKAEIPNFNNFGTNTIQNEIGPSSVISSTKAPAGWAYFLRGVNASCELQTEVVKEGKYAVKFTNKDPYSDGKYMAIYQTVPVEPNTIYKIGGWVKVENADRFYMYTDGFGSPVHWGKSGGNTHDWEEWEYTFTTGPNQTTRTLRITSNGVTDAGYLDGLYLVKEGSDENLIENGDFEVEPLNNSFYNVTTSEIKTVQNLLKQAEENNISVCLLVSPHYFPSFVLELYPELNYPASYGFIKYNIMEEKAKEVIEAYLRTLIPLVKDYTSLSSICVSNEPQFWSNLMADFYQPKWEEYIKAKHGTVEAMNEAYNTEYTSFSDCKIPTGEGNHNIFYDYKLFNDENFAEWHKFMCDIIKEIAPDIPLHAKIMEFPPNTGTSRLQAVDGTKLENFLGVLDWNGNDGANRYENIEKLSPLEEILWYDYQRSINNAPVLNTEDHIAVNNSKIYGDEISQFMIQAIWEGALHGRAFSHIWLWERHDGSNKSQTFRGNSSYRPDVVAGTGRTTHDLNRLSYEVVAIQEEKADVAILYSDAAAMHTREFGNMMRHTYVGTVYAGKKVQFVTEDQMYKLADCKALIIPRVLNAKSETVDAIYDFVKNGGKVLFIDERCLALDEYAKENDAEKVAYIRQNAEVISDVNCNNTTLVKPTKEDLYVLIREFIQKIGLDYVKAVDAKTGEDVENVLIDVGVYDSNLLVNVCNYGETRDLKIMVGDRVVSQSYDMIKNEELGENFAAEKYVSKFLKIEVDHSFVDVYGHWAEEYISGLSDKKLVSGMSESRFEPNGILTRAEFLTMLVRASGMGAGVYTGGISDVKAEDWYAGFVASAQSAGIIGNDAFRPNDRITREEMCELLAAFYENKNGEIPADEAEFTDFDTVNNKDAVNKAYALGFISGYEDGSFKPMQNMTRAEAVTVVTKYLEK